MQQRQQIIAKENFDLEQFFQQLPRDILAELLPYLSYSHISMLRRLSKTFRKIMDDVLSQPPQVIYFLSSISGQRAALFVNYYHGTANFKQLKKQFAKGEDLSSWETICLALTTRKMIKINDKFLQKAIMITNSQPNKDSKVVEFLTHEPSFYQFMKIPIWLSLPDNKAIFLDVTMESENFIKSLTSLLTKINIQARDAMRSYERSFASNVTDLLPVFLESIFLKAKVTVEVKKLRLAIAKHIASEVCLLTEDSSQQNTSRQLLSEAAATFAKTKERRDFIDGMKHQLEKISLFAPPSERVLFKARKTIAQKKYTP